MPLLASIIPFLKGLFTWIKDYLIITTQILIKILPKIIKWGTLLLIFNLCLTIFSFTLYSLYYWWVYILSHFVSIRTINILHSTLFWYIIYQIYQKIYSSY